jgi:hypothetical protein
MPTPGFFLQPGAGAHASGVQQHDPLADVAARQQRAVDDPSQQQRLQRVAQRHGHGETQHYGHGAQLRTGSAAQQSAVTGSHEASRSK